MYNIFNLQKRHCECCLYITLFFNNVAGIVQTFVKSWNQLLYPRVIEVCRLTFEPRHDFLHLIIVMTVQWLLLGFRSVVKNPCFISSHNGVQKFFSFLCVAHEKPQRRTSHLAGLWVGTAISDTFHSKPGLPLSNEHGSQVKDQGRLQCCHNKHKKISLSAYTWWIFTFRTCLVPT